MPSSIVQRCMSTSGSLLSRIAPATVARIGANLYILPPKLRTARKSDQATFDRAEQSEVTFRGRPLPAWEWGPAHRQRVLLVHGWGVTPTLFAPLIEALEARGFSVMTYLGPGHGFRRRHQCTLMTWAHALNEVTNTHGPFFALVGHCAGAGASVMANRLGLRFDCRVFFSSVSDLIENTDSFGRLLGMPQSGIAQMREYIWNWYEEDCGALGSYWDDLFSACVKEPVLMFHDRSDSLMSVQHAQRYADRWPQATLQISDTLGHYKIVRDPDNIEATCRFLENHLARPVDSSIPEKAG